MKSTVTSEQNGDVPNNSILKEQIDGEYPHPYSDPETSFGSTPETSGPAGHHGSWIIVA